MKKIAETLNDEGRLNVCVSFLYPFHYATKKKAIHPLIILIPNASNAR